MKRMIRYQVRPDRAAENEALVRKVYEELARVRPAGLRYATFKLDDGVSFVHLVSHDDDAARGALTGLAAFQAFTAGIRERCEDPPVTVDLSVVGSYGWFD